MPHLFDAANKFILDAFPADWIALGGLPPGKAVTVIDADLSAVSKVADKLVRVEADDPYVAHVEFQSGPDDQLDLRVLVYNVLARQQLELEVKSVVFLLRPEALRPGITGQVVTRSHPDHRLEFAYKLVRVWELPVSQLLVGGIGTLPLAPISAVGEAELPGVIEAMKRRFDAEVPAEQSRELWTATRILMGLRYSDEVTSHLLKGVLNMRESSTYQAILREGIEQGRLGEARAVLLRSGARQFGPPNPSVQARVESINDIPSLETLMDRILDHSAATWDELLGK